MISVVHVQHNYAVCTHKGYAHCRLGLNKLVHTNLATNTVAVTSANLWLGINFGQLTDLNKIIDMMGAYTVMWSQKALMQRDICMEMACFPHSSASFLSRSGSTVTTLRFLVTVSAISRCNDHQFLLLTTHCRVLWTADSLATPTSSLPPKE